MNRQVFNLQFTALVKAFVLTQDKVDPETEDVYWEMLKDIAEPDFCQGVRQCLATCKFFPTIAELGEASLPTKIELAPYQPRIYQEPIKLDWQAQLNRLKTQELRRGVRKLRAIKPGDDDVP